MRRSHTFCAPCLHGWYESLRPPTQRKKWKRLVCPNCRAPATRPPVEVLALSATVAILLAQRSAREDCSKEWEEAAEDHKAREVEWAAQKKSFHEFFGDGALAAEFGDEAPHAEEEMASSSSDGDDSDFEGSIPGRRRQRSSRVVEQRPRRRQRPRRWQAAAEEAAALKQQSLTRYM
eukprot:SAG11_NODE_2909_length_2845_cov_3.209395_3_plen_177_part_00